ncbi:RING finger protein 141 [Tribolium castaneum]|uniref:RING finger protein 141 n=1 Tax=Tribolium castaneum TaxID=7070 RepID=D2A361_TRICA|nr:PREDICTED: RING finger protein 141 [Tribolium castaneum]EFA02265.1 RING finger protein 141-like Protein [Tribolium castaneum]|eukprot:XP_974067.1 PREDICTED: RING finger protein 141 [Tribolium castaneum]
MGQQSSQFHEYFNDIITDEPVLTLLSEEIHTLSYEKFLTILGELNQLSKQRLDSEGKQLVFAVKKGTDSTVFWKATVQIACVKIDSNTQKVSTYRLLNLYEFLKVFKTLKCQSSAEEQSRNGMSVSQVVHDITDSPAENTKECCICLERKHEVILPCMHSYCLPCIEEWNATHDTCPICREKLESTDDTWVISEVPEAEEISKEIKSSLMELAEDKESPCLPS